MAIDVPDEIIAEEKSLSNYLNLCNIVLSERFGNDAEKDLVLAHQVDRRVGMSRSRQELFNQVCCTKL